MLFVGDMGKPVAAKTSRKAKEGGSRRFRLKTQAKRPKDQSAEPAVAATAVSVIDWGEGDDNDDGSTTMVVRDSPWLACRQWQYDSSSGSASPAARSSDSDTSQ